MKKDKMPHGFSCKDDTDVPQLQAHCKQLTEATRLSACRVFLNNVSLLLNSLSIWSSNDGRGARLTGNQQQAESNWLNLRLAELDKAFDSAVTGGVNSVKETLEDTLYEHFPGAIEAAKDTAGPTAMHWGAHRNDGGLYWATYKAVCRRDGGPFSGAGGTHDFNGQLAEPIERMMANRWETCFQRRMPKVLQAFNTKLAKMIKQFHDVVERRARDRGTGIVGLPLLYQQIETTTQRFTELAGRLGSVITEKQREANRELIPIITVSSNTRRRWKAIANVHKSAMLEGYQRCVNEHGPGSFKRIKAIMVDHVDRQAKMMFEHAVECVKEHLRQMRLEIEQDMTNEVEEVLGQMRQEYFAVIIGEKLPDGYVMSKQERVLRREIADLIQNADKTFRLVVADEADQEKMVVDKVAPEGDCFQ
jgi:hypothetical protein